MKLTVNPSYLLYALKTIKNAVSPNSSIPALTCTKMEVLEDRIVLTGCDNEMLIRTEIPMCELSALKIEEKGSFLFNPVPVMESLQNIKTSQVSIQDLSGDKNQGSFMQLTSDSGTYTFHVLPTDSYPAFDLSVPETSFSITGSQLSDWNKACYCAVPASSQKAQSRPFLAGMHLHAEAKEIQLTSTDSYRVTFSTGSIEDDIQADMTIMTKAVKELARLAGEEKNIQISFNNKKAQFSFGNTLIQSMLIEGGYPNISKIIPNDESMICTLTCPHDELLTAVKASMITADESKLGTLDISSDEFILSSKNPNTGTSTQRIFSYQHKGDPLQVHLNLKFLLDALNNTNCANNQVEMKFAGKEKPLKLKDPSNEHQISVLVPLRSVSSAPAQSAN